ncbi:MAG TPA: pyridoxal-dependent decarboxylase [Rhizomicrobium sp.]|nr:pyridoxal-dependent decarboxylase [Rhizomicrobium sp.]
MKTSSWPTLDPKDWPSFRRQAHIMLNDMLDYLEHTRERPVWQPIPDVVRASVHQPNPHNAEPLEDVYREFQDAILPYATGNTHPGFMGWVHGGGTPVGMLADMLAAGLNANLGGRDHMPIEIERQIAEWARGWFGFPQGASGLFVTGTSMANLMAVLIARAEALGEGVRAHGIEGVSLRAYAAKGVHGCVARAMDFAGLGSDALRLVPTDTLHRMDVAALDAMITEDRKAGCLPFLVVGTAGAVDTGAIDNLTVLSRIARKEKLWFHVDGAFGALAIWSEQLRPRLSGIEHADSIGFDFHKWGQVPYDAGFLLVRDGEKHRATFASPAAYLRRETRGLAAGSPWPTDFGPDLSRGFRALKTWFTLKTYGTYQLGRMIEQSCMLARHLEARVRTEPQLEPLTSAQLNIVCFRYRCDNADRINAEIVADLHEQGRVAPSATTIGGKLAIRAAFVNHRTEPCDADALVEAVLEAGAKKTVPATLSTYVITRRAVSA